MANKYGKVGVGAVEAGEVVSGGGMQSGSPASGIGSGNEPLEVRTLQITLAQDDQIRLARLMTRWVEKGFRPSACTKSAIIGEAIRRLAAAEGL